MLVAVIVVATVVIMLALWLDEQATRRSDHE